MKLVEGQSAKEKEYLIYIQKKNAERKRLGKKEKSD